MREHTLTVLSLGMMKECVQIEEFNGKGGRNHARIVTCMSLLNELGSPLRTTSSPTTYGSKEESGCSVNLEDNEEKR